MSLYPDVQAKAQAEIERVCGRSRLPEMADTDSLPYVQAIMYEVLRWHAIVPLSMPHVATEDDQYEGYFIPKGSVLIPNAWWVLVFRALLTTVTMRRANVAIGHSFMTQKRTQNLTSSNLSVL